MSGKTLVTIKPKSRDSTSQYTVWEITKVYQSFVITDILHYSAISQIVQRCYPESIVTVRCGAVYCISLFYPSTASRLSCSHVAVASNWGEKVFLRKKNQDLPTFLSFSVWQNVWHCRTKNDATKEIIFMIKDDYTVCSKTGTSMFLEMFIKFSVYRIKNHQFKVNKLQGYSSLLCQLHGNIVARYVKQYNSEE